MREEREAGAGVPRRRRLRGAVTSVFFFICSYKFVDICSIDLYLRSLVSVSRRRRSRRACPARSAPRRGQHSSSAHSRLYTESYRHNKRQRRMTVLLSSKHASSPAAAQPLPAGHDNLSAQLPPSATNEWKAASTGQSFPTDSHGRSSHFHAPCLFCVENHQ
jgi:hypothetical protein